MNYYGHLLIEMIGFMEFEPTISDDGIRLKDLTGANLNDIESCVFPDVYDLVERLEPYINDYIYDPEIDPSYQAIAQFRDLLENHIPEVDISL